MGKQVSVNLPKEIKQKLGIDKVKIPEEKEDCAPIRVASDGTILLEEEDDYDTTD